MDGIGVALIGYGVAGRIFHAPLLASVEGLRLHRVVSSRPDDVGRDCPDVRVVSCDVALADPGVELVVIATPNATHADLARRSLLAGKHVVVDKPFTVTVEQGEALIELATTTGRLLTVFHNRRWDADFITVRALLQRGVLGRVVQFESRFDRYRPEVRDRWREQPGPGSGAWFDLGSHLVDQALQLFGRPDAVSGDLVAQRTQAVAPDYFHVQLHYERLRVLLTSSSLAAAESPRFRIQGERATYLKLGFDTQEAALRSGERPGAGAAWGVDPRAGTLTRIEDGGTVTEEVPNAAGDYRAFYVGVREAVRHGTPPPVTAEEALSVMRVLEAVG